MTRTVSTQHQPRQFLDYYNQADHARVSLWPGPPNCSAAAIACFLGKSGRPVTEHATAARDPIVWSGRASQEVFIDLSACGLASMYPASDWSVVLLRAIMDI